MHLAPFLRNLRSLCVTEHCGNQSWASGSLTGVFLLHSGRKCDVQEGWRTVRGRKTKTKVPPIAAVVEIMRPLWGLGVEARRSRCCPVSGEGGWQTQYSNLRLCYPSVFDITWWPEMGTSTEIFKLCSKTWRKIRATVIINSTPHCWEPKDSCLISTSCQARLPCPC